MAKITLMIEDKEDGFIGITFECDPPIPKDMPGSLMSNAQYTGMELLEKILDEQKNIELEDVE